MNETIEHIISNDANGKPLAGEKSYRLLLPSHMPHVDFWSVTVYDIKTHLMIHTDQSWPSVYSSCKKLAVNKDGSITIWFGPKAPAGKETNWIKTIPGNDWYVKLSFYEPMEPWSDKNWIQGVIEEVEE